MGALLVFAGTYLLTTLVFPQYFGQIRAAAEAILSRIGRTPGEIAEQIQRTRSMYDPVANAFSGAIGVIFCGVIVSAILAIFIRHHHHPTAEHPVHAH